MPNSEELRDSAQSQPSGVGPSDLTATAPQCQSEGRGP
jgi:hypothetical protein